MWFIGVEVEQETSAPPPKKNPGSAPVSLFLRAKRERGKERNIHVRLWTKLYQNSLTSFPMLYKQ